MPEPVTNMSIDVASSAGDRGLVVPSMLPAKTLRSSSPPVRSDRSSLILSAARAWESVGGASAAKRRLRASAGAPAARMAAATAGGEEVSGSGHAEAPHCCFCIASPEPQRTQGNNWFIRSASLPVR